MSDTDKPTDQDRNSMVAEAKAMLRCAEILEPLPRNRLFRALAMVYIVEGFYDDAIACIEEAKCLEDRS